tara:strand:- start:1140 stop:1640 length:501 start_codon:yes stop_codon:yes gene_type:complete
MKNYKQNLHQIRAFIFDFDGVFTNGKIILTSKGDVYREINVKDGFSIQFALKKGYKIAVITAGTSNEIKKKLINLGINNVYLGANEKSRFFKDFVKKEKLGKNEILFVGDDIPDIEIMQSVGVSACPNDAAVDVKKISDYISYKKGGDGCIREIIEQVLRVQNKWI